MRLTVETGPLAGTVVTLERDRPAVIGSGEQCALRITQAGVREEHAVVKALKGEGFGIKAIGPTRVNGAEVQASPLQDGDVIEVGTTRIAYGDVQDSRMPQIAGYRILDVLGKGGMGTVYRAEQVSLSRQVALKVLNKDQTEDAMFVGKFVAEAQAAAKLHHPNVVSVFDVEHDGDTYYYSMELMHEGSCEDWLRQNGTMPVDRALQVVADAAQGLAYAESLGIVHRDIKPDNLMLDQHGGVKIADLGLASTAADGREAHAIGTPHFMAPEQVLKQDLDHRTDLYALGCTFYRLVTGRTPFRGQTVKDILRAQVKDGAEPANKVNPDVPPEVAEIIARLMAKAPADRYQTANELLEELEILLQPPQKRGLWIGLAAAAVLVAGGAIWWAATRPDKIKTVKETVVYDDPEKQQFADRIKVLEGEAKEKDATIALLNARVSGADDEALAKALDDVASAHVGTDAAREATRRADALRQAIAERERLREQRRAKVADHLAKVRRDTLPALDALDFERAMRALDFAPPKDIAREAELADGLQKLRDEITSKARARIDELKAPVLTAAAGDDEAALNAAIEALVQGLQPATRWPDTVAADLASAQKAGETALATLTDLQKQRRADTWQTYHDLVAAQDLRHAIETRDFAAAAAALDAFAGSATVADAATRARGLAESARGAERYAEVLVQACKTGQLELTLGGERATIQGWDRAAHQLAVRYEDRRRNKDETLACDKLIIDQWRSLVEQAGGGADGDRASFLGLLALDAHTRAGRTYLARLQAGADDTGTGEEGYPYGADIFDGALEWLPQGEEPWLVVLRDELAAGKRLASGLRAMSERRNLAAAGHIDKLLAEHPHSLVVSALR